MRKGLIASALVLTAVVLGASVFREQVASAADKVQSVFVTNDASHPVPVTSADDPGRQAFAFFKSDSWDSGDSHDVSFTVPAGKRLVIEAVSISGLLDTHGQKMLTAAVQAHVLPRGSDQRTLRGVRPRRAQVQTVQAKHALAV